LIIKQFGVAKFTTLTSLVLVLQMSYKIKFANARLKIYSLNTFH